MFIATNLPAFGFNVSITTKLVKGRRQATNPTDTHNI